VINGQQTVKPCLWKTNIADKKAGFVMWVNQERKRAEKYGTVSIENGTRPDWNEVRAKPRRTSAPTELPPIKDGQPMVKIKTRASTLLLRGENNEMHTKQWNTTRTHVNDSVLQKRISEIHSTVHGSVKAICIPVADSEQRPLSAWTNSNNSVETQCLGINNENSPLKHAGKGIGRKCLTQEALICHELGYAEDEDEDSTSQKKDMIVRWLNSEVF